MRPAADGPADGAKPSYARCLGLVREAAAGFPDMRKGGNTSHTIPDAVMSAFARRAVAGRVRRARRRDLRPGIPQGTDPS